MEDPVRSESDTLLTAYMEAIHQMDRRAAIAVADRALSSGWRPEDVACDLLIPAQRRVGQLWLANEFSVADEHMATAIAESVLRWVSDAVEHPDPEGPAVVLACPEGEYHCFGLRVTEEVLIRGGIRVHYLGQSVPTSHLLRFIEKAEPAWLGFTVNVPINVVGVRRVLSEVRAAHGGLPLVLGGRLAVEKTGILEKLGVNAVVDDARRAVELDLAS